MKTMTISVVVGLLMLETMGKPSRQPDVFSMMGFTPGMVYAQGIDPLLGVAVCWPQNIGGGDPRVSPVYVLPTRDFQLRALSGVWSGEVDRNQGKQNTIPDWYRVVLPKNMCILYTEQAAVQVGPETVPDDYEWLDTTR